MDAQLELFSHGLERIGLLVNTVAEGLGELCKLAFGLLLAQISFKLGAHRLKAGGSSGFDVGEQNDVVAELRLNNRADVAFFFILFGIFKGFDHGPFGKKVEVSPFAGGARVLRVFPGKFGKVFGVFAQIRQQCLCF